MRSTPQLPLVTPEVDPEKIIRRQKTLQEGTSTVEPGDSGNFHYSPIETPVAVSHFPITPSVGASRSLNFGSFPTDYPSPSFTTPPPIKVFLLQRGKPLFPRALRPFLQILSCFPLFPEAHLQSPLFELHLLLVLLQFMSKWWVLILLGTGWMRYWLLDMLL
jgi:hypothetical protein